MMLETYQLIFSIVGVIAIIIMIVSQIILRFTLDRRVRSYLPDNKKYESFYDSFFGLWRSSLFANANILPGKRFQKVMDVFYDGFKIKGFANQFEKVVAYLNLFSGLIIILCIPIFYITKWLGIFEW